MESLSETSIVPVWLGVEYKEVAHFNPVMADVIAVVVGQRQIVNVAHDILKVIRPDLCELIHLNFSLIQTMSLSQPELVKG